MYVIALRTGTVPVNPSQPTAEHVFERALRSSGGHLDFVEVSCPAHGAEPHFLLTSSLLFIPQRRSALAGASGWRVPVCAL